jgi:biotin carboxylase
VASPRILLLLPTTSYKALAFLDAAAALSVEVVVGTDRRQALEAASPGHTLAFDLADTAASLDAIRREALRTPFAAVLGVDDETTLLASEASRALGLPHNAPDAIRATRNKHEMRERLAAAGRPGPRFRLVSRAADPTQIAREVGYPCVLKPVALSAGRGVIRADDPPGFVAAFARVSSILDDRDAARGRGVTDHVLVEQFLSGEELALEGLLVRGRLETLALFDKPDPLEGPFFEETLLVTPSRKAPRVVRAVVEEGELGCRALGLEDGPVHAELRLDRGRPWIVEIAARTIGGLCSRALRFGAGVSLEELVLRHALGRSTDDLARERRAAGAMMMPIPRGGILRAVHGVDAARAVPGIEEVRVALHPGAEVVPLPEGHRYLGFIIARADRPADVEVALRRAHACLSFAID